jgi:hypothetical protein
MAKRQGFGTFGMAFGAARMGTSVGKELRSLILDQKEAQRLRAQGLPEPEKRIYFQTIGQNAVLTTSIAATILALCAKRRRPLAAFVIGVLLTLLVGDRFDQMLLPMLRKQST